MKKTGIKKVVSATMTTPAYPDERGRNIVRQKRTLKQEPDLFEHTPGNYLESGIISRILRWPQYQTAVHILTTAVFLLIIYSGLTGGNDQKMVEGSVLATAFVWDIWHPLLAFSILIIGRFWCSVCPLGAIHSWVSRTFSLNRKYPEKFRNVWIAIALFIFVTAAERHLFRFTRNPEATAFLLLTFLGIAIVMGMVYEKRTFCKFVCPTGLVLGVFSMFSGSELRCSSKDVCKAHKDKECLTGNEHGHGCPMYEFPQTMERNNSCIYCTQCIKTCSKNNIRVSTRPLGMDVLKSKKVYSDEAFFVHSITVIMFFLMGMEHTPFRNRIIELVHWLGIDRNIMAVVILTGISISAVLLMYLAMRGTHDQQHARNRFVSYSYAFIPLGLAAYMAWNLFKLIRGIFFGMYEVTHWAGLNIINGNPSLDYGTINLLQILILIAGFVFSLWLGYGLSRSQNGNILAGSGIAGAFAVMTLYTAIGLWILTLPVLDMT
ncbi:MAG: 4Fe-4S binding protein [Methanosarcinales archaeon]|nr:4Fe-4S binding protein [ANME-2 cluster archaeon]MDW7777027.1 4Fe-4S binding protein [Methanosarcinales archaeon]